MDALNIPLVRLPRAPVNPGAPSPSGSPWRLCVCGTCGSAGTHLACSDLRESVTSWVCPDCTLEPPGAGSSRKKSNLREFIASKAADAGALTQVGGAGVLRCR